VGATEIVFRERNASAPRTSVGQETLDAGSLVRSGASGVDEDAAAPDLLTPGP